MAADTSPGGGLSQLEDHYNTFITEKDIAEIAGAGLNWIRLPVPFWAIESWTDRIFFASAQVLPSTCLPLSPSTQLQPTPHRHS